MTQSPKKEGEKGEINEESAKLLQGVGICSEWQESTGIRAIQTNHAVMHSFAHHSDLVYSMELRNWQNDQLSVRYPMGDAIEARYGAPHYTLHRADLHTLLYEQISAECIHLGKRCTGVKQDRTGVELTFADIPYTCSPTPHLEIWELHIEYE